MDTNEFLELFIKELGLNSKLRDYYRILDSRSSFLFRKAYLEQRLKYISLNTCNKSTLIWDLGCGYGTTSIFLCLNGYKVTGTTLEFYYDKIRARLDYWSKFGNLDSLDIRYENLYDKEYKTDTYDTIILQDTLHHLEPITDAFKIFNHVLKMDGKIIVCEENGNNIIINIKNFLNRGFKRITEIYDEKLDEKILLGNENTRSLKQWGKLFSSNNFSIDNELTEYIRFLPPGLFKETNYNDIINKEQRIWEKHKLLREFLFFGINFVAHKTR